MYNIISIITIVLLTIIFLAFVGILIYYKATKNRAKLVNTIKGFKYGKWAFINLATIPLTTAGFIYEGYKVGEAIFRGITASAKLIAFGFDLNFKLTSANPLFQFALYYAYALVLLNTLAFAASCLYQIIWYFNRKCAFNKNLFKKHFIKNKEFCIIVGDNINNELIYDSRLTAKTKVKKVVNKNNISEEIVKTKYSWNKDTVLMDVLTKDQMLEQLIENKKYIPAKSQDNIFESLKDTIDKFLNLNSKLDENKKKTLSIVVNFKNEDKALALTSKLVGVVSNYAEKASKLKEDETNSQSLINNLIYLKIYIYGSKDNLDIYDKFNKNSKGCVRLVNKYTQIADEFCEKYPLSLYTSKYVDKSTALIKDEYKDLKINVVFIGFGNTNKQVFLSMFPIAQFIKNGKHYVRKEINNDIDNGNSNNDFIEKIGVVPQPVDYYIFDSQRAWDDNNLSHYYNRYESEYFDKYSKEERRKLFWLDPEFSGKVHDPILIGTDEKSFYDKLYPIINCKNESVTYIIISVGNDYETIDLTNKINKKINQWGLHNCHLFASVKSDGITNAKQNYLDKPTDPTCTCNVFGSYKKSIYNFKKITDQNWLDVGIAEDYVYDCIMGEQPIHVGWSIPAWKKLAWNQRTAYKFKVSYLSARSIRHKLLLFGYDIKLKEDVTPQDTLVTREQYQKAYSKGFELKFEPVKGKDGFFTINYPDCYDYDAWTPSLRRNLAILEHSRWTGLMITEGYIPMPKSHIQFNTEARDESKLEHANMSGYDDIWYYMELGKKFKHQNTNKIPGDYKFLDNLGWYADSYGFAITKATYPKQ